VKKYRYVVETTGDIAKEMARYEDSIYQKAGFIGFGFVHPITDETKALERCEELGFEPDNVLNYRWEFESDTPPAIHRWASFNVGVKAPREV